MRKKILALCMTSVLAATSLIGCGSSSTDDQAAVVGAGYASDAELKVWCSQEDQEMYKTIIKQFKEDNPVAKDWTISYGVVNNGDAKEQILKDISVAADIFNFPSDQLQSLQAANALYRITKNKDQIIANCSEAAVNSAMVNGELYGYPVIESTFVMFYDKSMYTEEEVKNLNIMMEKDLPSGVINFSMDISNGWYNSCFFQGVGCRLFGEDGTDSTLCDFDSERGVLAGNYMIDLGTDSKFARQDDALLLKGFENRTLAATFTGPWNAKAIQEYLGDDYGVCKLPEITLENGETVQLSSMTNFSLTGVNAQTKYPAEAMLLAEYITNNVDILRTRYDMRPDAYINNTIAKEIQDANENQALVALADSSQYSVIQTSIPQIANFWTPASAFGEGILDGSITKENVQDKLAVFVDSILTKLTN